ncbi:MAG: hypothetical protein J7549_05010 [Variovorax sp.]|nr:hypothetical protein [Variovorax sp.]
MPVRHVAAVAALLGGLVSIQAWAQPTFSGYLCCNLRTDGSWASDSNYAESGKRIIPVGTPVRVTGYGRYRVQVEIGGGKQAIGNDYSRDIDLGSFAQRWVVQDDPAPKIASFPPKIREAIKEARVTKGMTRDQVAMAVGWPISSENPKLDAEIWRMWISSFAEYQVVFDKAGRVREVVTDPQTKNLVVMD